MFSADGSVAIVFNGEIYGYKELKRKLSYPFKTQSDTEVILALYQKYGTGLTHHLPGMFSFAIWDENKQLLFAARDRFGEKPFFFVHKDNNTFLFASEVKALLASGLVNREIDPYALAHYFKHLYVHPHHSIFKAIRPLPPAHQIIYQNGNLEIKKYWELPATRPSVSMDDAVEQLAYLIDNSVEKQLVADVPIGAFLSGGLDSGSIVSTAANKVKQLTTFSLGFEQGENELALAKSLSEKYGTHHLEYVDADFDLAKLVLEMQGVYDEPFADSSNIPTYLISKFASEQMKVVLTGDGGDELLGGYDFWYTRLLDLPLHKYRGNWREHFLNILSHVMPISSWLSQHYERELSEFKLWKQGDWVTSQHLTNNVYFTDNEISKLGLSQWPNELYGTSKYHSNTVEDAMKMDIENYMPGDILVKTDRASMANGLELRSPFLDQGLAEFCISLPSYLKLSKNESKILLRKAMANKLTSGHWKQKKTGFGAPVGKWLSDPGVTELNNDIFHTGIDKLKGLVPNSSYVAQYQNEGGYKQWICMNFLLWADKWI
jgi:asparagine synthase (glutamine-hydrolysing)